QTTADFETKVSEALSAEEILHLSHVIRRVPIADHLARYAIAITRQTRTRQTTVPEMVSKYVSWGAGPRASQFLVLGAKARAALQGRHCVEREDIQAVAAPVLRHRLITNFNAEADGVRADDVIRHL